MCHVKNVASASLFCPLLKGLYLSVLHTYRRGHIREIVSYRTALVSAADPENRLARARGGFNLASPTIVNTCSGVRFRSGAMTTATITAKRQRGIDGERLLRGNERAGGS